MVFFEAFLVHQTAFFWDESSLLSAEVKTSLKCGRRNMPQEPLERFNIKIIIRVMIGKYVKVSNLTKTLFCNRF